MCWSFLHGESLFFSFTHLSWSPVWIWSLKFLFLSIKILFIDTRYKFIMPRAFSCLCECWLGSTGMNHHERECYNFAIGYGAAFPECGHTEGLWKATGSRHSSFTSWVLGLTAPCGLHNWDSQWLWAKGLLCTPEQQRSVCKVSAAPLQSSAIKSL